MYTLIKKIATFLTLSTLAFSPNLMATDTKVPDCSPDPYGPPATCGNPYVGRFIAKKVGSPNYVAICTGSLAYLNDTAVVTTAAHCVDALNSGVYENPIMTFDSRAYVAVGGQLLTAQPVISPTDFDPNRYVSIDKAIDGPWDLGVLLIDKENTDKLKALYPDMRPLPLAPLKYLDRFVSELHNGSLNVTYAGYGHSVFSYHGASPHFYYLLSSDGSRRFGILSYLNHTPKGEIRFQENLNLDNTQIANGDSGSPNIVNGLQVGVTSRYLPGVYFISTRTEDADALNFFCQYIPNITCPGN